MEESFLSSASLSESSRVGSRAGMERENLSDAAWRVLLLVSGGFRAMMVLLLKQTHLQKEVALVRAARVVVERSVRVRIRRGVGRRIVRC